MSRGAGHRYRVSRVGHGVDMTLSLVNVMSGAGGGALATDIALKLFA